jgi:hypothetical protein
MVCKQVWLNAQLLQKRLGNDIDALPKYFHAINLITHMTFTYVGTSLVKAVFVVRIIMFW